MPSNRGRWADAGESSEANFRRTAGETGLGRTEGGAPYCEYKRSMSGRREEARKK